MSTGEIVVKRRNVLQDAVRSYTVFIDDKPVGKMWAFQTKSFEVSSGAHQLQLKIVHTGKSCSDIFPVEVAPEGRYVFRTHSRGLLNALKLPFALPGGAAALANDRKLESRFYEGPWIRLRQEEQ
jgi:hypothetical protein